MSFWEKYEIKIEEIGNVVRGKGRGVGGIAAKCVVK